MQLWLFLVATNLNFWKHFEHSYGVSPVWTLMCVLSWVFSLNLFPHSVHWWGVSPVWTLMCLFNCCLWTKPFPQREQICLKILLCLSSHKSLKEFFLKDFPQWEQMWIFMSSFRRLWWACKWYFSIEVLRTFLKT